MLDGLAADIGEIGVRGKALGDLRVIGDLSGKDGRVAFCAAEMLKDSFGFIIRAELYMMAELLAK